MTKALVVAGGDFPKNFKEKDFDYVLAVDRGLEYLIAKNIAADFIIGDFDSVRISQEDFPGGKILKYPKEKSMTDLEIAIEKLIDLGVDEVYILAATGSRLDHSLINILLLKKLFANGIRAYIINDNNLIFMDQGEIEVEKNNFTYLSIIPLEPCKISLAGFKYQLENADLDFPSTLTISNEIQEDFGKITVDKACFIIQAND